MSRILQKLLCFGMRDRLSISLAVLLVRFGGLIKEVVDWKR